MTKGISMLVVVSIAVAVVLAIVLARRDGGADRRDDRVGKRVDEFGPFSVVTRDVGYFSGWNEGRVKRRYTQAHSVLYRGRPFAFEGLGGMNGDETREYRGVNAVVALDGPEPALIVNVGDPNNLNFHYLLREIDGEPVTRLLTRNSGALEARYVDVPGGGAEYADPSQHYIRVSGGRWLLLGRHSVFDVERREVFRVDAPHEFGLSMLEPLALAPDHRSIVWRGSRYPDLAIIVTDFVEPRADVIDVDRTRMRLPDAQKTDVAWLEHHFRWVTDENGVDRLRPRDDFDPLPHRGRLIEARSENSSSLYTVEPVGSAMAERLVAFIVDEFDGTRVEDGETVTLLKVAGTELRVSWREGYVSLAASSFRRSAVIDEIAPRFDALLATGALDDLFFPTRAEAR